MIFTVILFIALRFLSVWECFGHFIRHSKCHVHHICIEIASHKISKNSVYISAFLWYYYALKTKRDKKDGSEG